MIFSVKLLPLILGAVFNMILGMLWYSNVLFAKPWMKEAGVKMEDVQSSKDKMGSVYTLTTLFAFVTSYVLGLVITNFGISNVWIAIVVGVLLWVGLSLPMVIKNWGFEGRSVKLGLINHGYELVVFVVVAVLYAVL